MGWDKTRYQERLEEFRTALDRLQEARDLLKSHPQPGLREALRDSLIQRFEFCYELAWKAAKLWLESKNLHHNNPKDVLREALKQGLIEDGNGWSELQQNRNLTSHTYDRKLAENVAAFVERKAFILFEALRTEFAEKKAE